MEPDHVRWITRPSTLDAFDLRVVPPLSDDVDVACRVQVVAYCLRRPKPLFNYEEPVSTFAGDMTLTDLIHHFALVLDQDRPTTRREFIDGLMGQQKLPY